MLSVTLPRWEATMPSNSRKKKLNERYEHGKQLLSQIEEAHSQLKSLMEESDDSLRVTVITAVEMDAKLRKKALEKAQELYQGDVQLRERVDPTIMGGIIFEAPNHKRYDASVRTQLAAVRRNLSESYAGGLE